jgi:hypothetical protein
MSNENERVSTSDDGETGYIEHLTFRGSTGIAADPIIR